MKKNQTGRSMVEMLGVLAIIGVLSIGGIAGYSMAMGKYRVNKAVEAVTFIVTEVRTMFANEDNYSNLGSSGTIGDVAATIVNNVAADSPYKIELFEKDGGFIVDVETGASVDACVGLLTKDWSAFGGDFAGASAGDTEPKYQYSVSKAKSECETNSDPGLRLFFNGNTGLLDQIQADVGIL